MSNEDQTFVILTPGFAANESDSTCLPMQQHLVRMINRLYPQLQIIILSFQYPYHEKSYQWFGNTIISFNGRNRGGLRRLLLRKKIMKALKMIYAEKKIIGILSFWYGECAVVGKKFGDKYGIKHKCWLLGQDARAENHYPKRMPLEAGELLALSDFIQDEFERNHYKRPAVVLPPAVKEETHYSTDKDIDILAAGSLIPLKQYHIFIEAIANIKKALPTVNAVLIGDGPEKRKLQNLILKLDLNDNVFLAGELSHGELLQHMQRAKVFLHPSSYEGFGVVCLEALAGGAQVISFVQPMYRQIKNWHIVKTKEEMEQKAIDILQSADTVYENVIVYKMEDVARQLVELYSYEGSFQKR